MDVYHKVLTKLFTMTGGKDSVDIDLAELLKKEGFFPSMDNIRDYLSTESWIAETNRKNIIRITHWGVAEAKRTLSNTPDRIKHVEKDSKQLVGLLKECLVMTEEFSSSPTEDKIPAIEERLSQIKALIERIKNNI